jgi:hypothetical protein
MLLLLLLLAHQVYSYDPEVWGTCPGVALYQQIINTCGKYTTSTTCNADPACQATKAGSYSSTTPYKAPLGLGDGFQAPEWAEVAGPAESYIWTKPDVNTSCRMTVGGGQGSRCFLAARLGAIVHWELVGLQ